MLGKQRKEFAVGESPQRAERAGASESKGRMKTGTKNVSATCFRHLVHPPSRHGGTTEDGPEDPLSSSRAGAPREHEQSNYPKIHSSSRPSRRQARSPAVKPSQVHKKNPQSSLAGIWISDLRPPTSANPAFHPIPTYSGGCPSRIHPKMPQQFVFIRVHSWFTTSSTQKDYQTNPFSKNRFACKQRRFRTLRLKPR